MADEHGVFEDGVGGGIRFATRWRLTSSCHWFLMMGCFWKKPVLELDGSMVERSLMKQKQ